MNLPMIEVLAPLSDVSGDVIREQENLKPALDNDCMHLELSSRTLRRLLTSGQLCAADFRCLDCATKHCVWRLMARLCAHSLDREECCAQCDRVAQKVPGHLLKQQYPNKRSATHE